MRFSVRKHAGFRRTRDDPQVLEYWIIFFRGSSVHIFEIHVAESPTFFAHVFGRVDAVLKRNGVDQKMGKVFE